MAKSIITGEEIPDNSPFAAAVSGVSYESQMDAATISPEERQEQYTAEGMQAFAEKVSSDEGLTADDMMMAARSFVDGLWFNKSEEVGSAITALAVSVLNPELAKGKDFSQIRKEVLSAMEANTAAFEEENPWLALGSNVAGGILNPVALTGGQVISQAYNLKKGYDAARVADDVAAAVAKSPMASAIYGTTAARSGDAGRLAAQYGAQQAGQNMGMRFAADPLGKITQRIASVQNKAALPAVTAGLMGAEGAVFGYEGDTTQDKITNAAITAGISAAIPFAWAGAKQTYSSLAKNRLAQQLGEGGNFVSLMFTEHALAPVYRHVVSKAYGGFGLMEQQARRIAGLALTPNMAKRAGAEMREEAAKRAASAKEALKVKSLSDLNKTTAGLDDEIARLKLAAEEAVGVEKAKYKQSIELLEQAKFDSSALKAEAVKQGDAAVSAAEASFRGRAFQESVPPGAIDEFGDELAEMGSLRPQDANELLDSLWKQHGFKSADNYTYTVNPKEAIAELDRLALGYPELALVGGEKGNIVSLARQFVKQVLPPEGQQISGPALLQVRSDIGRAINGMSDNAPSARRFASELQDYFHDILEKSMSEADRVTFAKDRAAWSVRSMVDDSIAQASSTAGKQGAFTPDDWLSTVKKFSSRFAARGQGRLQREADEVAAAAKQNEQNILELANQEAKKISQEALSNRAATLKQLESAKVSIKRELASDIAKLQKAKRAAKAGSDEKIRIGNEIAERRNHGAMQLDEIDRLKARAEQETDALKDLMPSSFKASVFERLFNTSMIGQVLARGAGVDSAAGDIAATLATGAVGARILAAEATQRMLAGQTGWQATMRSLPSGRAGDAVRTAAKAAGGAPAAVAQGVTPTGLTIPKDKQQQILAAPKAVRVGVYRNLEKTGRLEKLKAESPAFYRELKKAAN